ncbi:MAG: hydrolase Nlp/P60 [Bacteroidia bacterium]|nr:MAG: hydrolase Nlp/P60 [Bacteroidia bacterium]
MMDSPYGICKLAIIPGRLESSSKSEMVTQLLFGETYSILEEQAQWLKIKIHSDGYECWINRLQHSTLSETGYQQIQSQPLVLSAELLQIVQSGKNHLIVPFGSRFPNYQNNQFKIEATIFEAYGKVNTISETISYNGQACVDYAFMFLNCPYLWGGKTFMGIDCSGLVQVCCALAGYSLPRDAKDQALHGTPLTFLDEVQPGDLAFFHNEEGNIVHTGILINQEYIIHASGRVRVDKIDHYGIFSPELKDHSHHLRVIKRLK